MGLGTRRQSYGGGGWAADRNNHDHSDRGDLIQRIACQSVPRSFCWITYLYAGASWTKDVKRSVSVQHDRAVMRTDQNQECSDNVNIAPGYWFMCFVGAFNIGALSIFRSFISRTPQAAVQKHLLVCKLIQTQVNYTRIECKKRRSVIIFPEQVEGFQWLAKGQPCEHGECQGHGPEGLTQISFCIDCEQTQSNSRR